MGEFGRHNTVFLDCAPGRGPYPDNVVLLQRWKGPEDGRAVEAVNRYLLAAAAARPRSVSEYLRSHPQQLPPGGALRGGPQGTFGG